MNSAKMFFFVCCMSVIFSPISAFEQESISINKPIMRSPKPWHFSSDYVRCFCNLPSCVTTGYMCKSSGGGCFSDLQEQSSVYKGRHGCLELLSDKEQKSRCNSKGGINERTTIRRKDNPKSLFLCCHHDMCNHIESPQTKNIINNTLLGDVAEDSDNRFQQQQQEPFLYSNSEVWFRAATIAVPICGAVILFVLIALAVKILKSEHQNSAIRKLGPAMYAHPVPPQCKATNEKYGHQDHFERTYDNLLKKEYVVPTQHQNIFYSNQNEDFQRQIHVPLLVQNELLPSNSGKVYEKNERPNLIGCDTDSTKSIILEIEKNTDNCLDKNINSNVKYPGDIDKFCLEKAYLS
uniref:BMP and activin membrane-bound inhibitor n=1 Tax=Anoplophora glabripennis TaxID=217634 RepID=V5GPZ6_ANOGL